MNFSKISKKDYLLSRGIMNFNKQTTIPMFPKIKDLLKFHFKDLPLLLSCCQIKWSLNYSIRILVVIFSAATSEGHV